MYRLLRNAMFLLPPETIHHLAMGAFGTACSVPSIHRMLQRNHTLTGVSLQKHLMGLDFRNPVGLAAGFDKNGLYLKEIETLGFGFLEVGSVTPKPQAGNEKPRLFRLPADKALINRMGFNNDGVKAVAARLRKWKNDETDGNRKKGRMIIGGNIGKNKTTPNEDAWKDYEICFRELSDCVDYFVVNVSSPNTPGLRELQEKESLHKILSHLQTINQRLPNPKPLLLKIAPDLSKQQLDDVIQLSFEVSLDGIVATNTTIAREGLSETSSRLSAKIGAGGLSGSPLKEMSTDTLRYISMQANGRLLLIGSGGIFTGDDANEKIKAGASLVQVWTGFIYEGPFIAKNICLFLKAQASKGTDR